jgi:hypothetical protein
LQARVELLRQPSAAEQYFENAVDGGVAASPIGGSPSTQGNEDWPPFPEPVAPPPELAALLLAPVGPPPLPPCSEARLAKSLVQVAVKRAVLIAKPKRRAQAAEMRESKRRIIDFPFICFLLSRMAARRAPLE